ncbi:hypothetical protein MKX01_030597 [Papaver californicum]|nr:hypothetical protein MKX01_030597 [Papaver californicum]
MRRLYATEIFSRKRIQDSVDLRRRCVDKMINWIKNEANGTSIEVVPFVLATSFNLIGNLVLSRDPVDPKSTKGNEFFHLTVFFPSLRWLDPQGIKKKVKGNLDLILEIISGFVEERRMDNKQDKLNKQGNDFLDVLLEFEGNGKDELLTAGTENIIVTAEWAMAELLRNPEALKKVQTEISQVFGHDRKIEESDITIRKRV